DRGHRALVYVYVSSLDLVGHLRGAGDNAWGEQLAIVDRIAERIAGGLPTGSSLVVTADHGMVTVPDGAKVDFDTVAGLQDGVTALAGEPRMRHVHTRPGAAVDVRDRWRDLLGPSWHVTTRDEAISAGWFGPEVTAKARGRIGDVLALALGDGGV